MEGKKLAVGGMWMSDKTIILIIQDLLKYFQKKLTKLKMDFYSLFKETNSMGLTRKYIIKT
jgi:hypothetical protein